jgi:hypothetical protein
MSLGSSYKEVGETIGNAEESRGDLPTSLLFAVSKYASHHQEIQDSQNSFKYTSIVGERSNIHVFYIIMQPIQNT